VGNAEIPQIMRGLSQSSCATLHKIPEYLRRSTRCARCREPVSHALRGRVQDGAGTLGFMAQELWDSAQELWDLTAGV